MSRQEIQVVVESEWWQVVLSGVIGSVIGGLLTLIGVWLVIRHERQMRDMEVLAGLVSRAAAAAERLIDEVKKQRPTEEFDRAKREYRYAMNDLVVNSLRTDRNLGLILADVSKKEDGGLSYSVYTLSAVLTVLGNWRVAPDWIRTGKYTRESLEEMFDKASSKQEPH